MELVNEAVVVVAQMLANELLEDVKRKKKKKKRRLWVRKWISMGDYKTPCKHIRLDFEHASFEQGSTHARNPFACSLTCPVSCIV
jgi:hypothetical protein